ncbi:MAG TPA: LPXTG cell wall anchor domain-containing protein [Gaiellales bacterium]|jgi:LPXTG-motif cell wall-anchored protein|nr:LPXTG cell wall anchor domain-containing protein [Gaiellales bacterium]
MTMALLSAPPPASLPLTGADVVLYLVVAAIVMLTGLVVRWSRRRAHLRPSRLSAARKLQ